MYTIHRPLIQPEVKEIRDAGSEDRYRALSAETARGAVRMRLIHPEG